MTEITITGCPDNNIINVGNDHTLQANFEPANVYEDYKKVEWSSSDTDVATVDENGKVIGIKAGEVTITATAKNGSEDENDWVRKSVTITVAQPVTTVTIIDLPDDGAMDVGKDYTLAATFNDDAHDSYKKVEWLSSDTDVATVDQNGKVTGIKAGTVTITAIAKNGSEDENDWVTKSVTITVAQPAMEILISDVPDVMNINDKVTLTATISPPNATTNPVKWSTSDNQHIKVSENTGKIEVTTTELMTTVTIVASVDGFSSSVQIPLINSKEWINCVRLVAKKVCDNVENNTLYRAYMEALNAFESDANESTLDAVNNANSKLVSVSNCVLMSNNALLMLYRDKYEDSLEYLDDVLESSAVKKIVINEKDNNLYVYDGANLSETIIRDLCHAKESAQNCDVNNPKKRLETDLRVAYASLEVTKNVFEQFGFTDDDDYKSIPTMLNDLNTLIARYFSKSTVIFAADSIQIQNSPSSDMVIGTQHQLSWNVRPENAANKMPIWSSSYPDVVFVDPIGVIAARQAGNALITAKIDDQIQDTVSVTVRDYETETVTCTLDDLDNQTSESGGITLISESGAREGNNFLPDGANTFTAPTGKKIKSISVIYDEDLNDSNWNILDFKPSFPSGEYNIKQEIPNIKRLEFTLIY